MLLCDDTTSFVVELSGMNLTLVNGFGWNFINANLNGSLNVIKMEIVVKQQTPPVFRLQVQLTQLSHRIVDSLV